MSCPDSAYHPRAPNATGLRHREEKVSRSKASGDRVVSLGSDKKGDSRLIRLDDDSPCCIVVRPIANVVAVQALVPDHSLCSVA